MTQEQRAILMKIRQYLSIFTFLFIFNTQSQADALFYGIALINQTVTQEIKSVAPAAPSSISIDESASGLGLYADYFYKGDYRFNGTISFINYELFKLTSLTASADLLYPLNSAYTLFTGATLGSAAMQFNGGSLSDSSLGTLYGIQAGAIGFFSNGIMIELGYRLRSANIETDIFDAGIRVATSSINDLNETYLNLIITF